MSLSRGSCCVPLVVVGLRVVGTIRCIINLIIIGIISRGRWSSWHLLLRSSFRARCWRVSSRRRISWCAGSVERFLGLRIRLINMFNLKVIILMLFMSLSRKQWRNNLFSWKMQENVSFANNVQKLLLKMKVICRIDMVSSFLSDSIVKI